MGALVDRHVKPLPNQDEAPCIDKTNSEYNFYGLNQMVENVNIWGRKQQNREEKLQLWATNPEIAEIFHSSAKKFFGSGAVSFPKPQKADLFPPGGANPAGILTGAW